MQEFMLTQELMQSTRSSVSSGKGNRGLAPWAMDVDKTKRQTSVESLIFCDGREDENDRFQCFYMSLTSVANCFPSCLQRHFLSIIHCKVLATHFSIHMYAMLYLLDIL